jgi:hypothetical protein
MKSLFCLFSLAGLLTTALRADTLELTTGVKIEGTVVAYSNLHFHVSTPDLRTTKHPAAYVKRATFEERRRATTVETRNGPVTGKLVSFEGTIFFLMKEDGKAQQVQSIFVKSIRLPPPGIEAEDAGLGDGEPTDRLELPEAMSHGEEIELKDLLATGKVTVVFFYGNIGPGIQNRLLNNYLNNILSKDHPVVIRKIDIGQWDSPIAKQYEVKAIPRLDIYDSTGKLAHSVIGNRLAEISSAMKKIR